MGLRNTLWMIEILSLLQFSNPCPFLRDNIKADVLSLFAESSHPVLTNEIDKGERYLAIPVPPKPAPAPKPAPGPPTISPTKSNANSASPTAKPTSGPITSPTKPNTSASPTKSTSPTDAPTSSVGATNPPTSSNPSNLCIKTGGAPLIPSAVNTCAAYKAVKAAFLAAIPADAFGQANIFGQAVRLPFHDAGEVDITKSDSSRSDGCLSSDSANAGLVESTSIVNTVFEPIWQANCNLISRADFWVLIGQLAIEAADPTKTIAFPFVYGRTDVLTCNAGTGRLPDAQLGQTGISQVFVTQMGLTMSDAVNLIGSHTLGHVHTTNSGFGKPGVPSTDNNLNAWDTTPNVFDNQ